MALAIEQIPPRKGTQTTDTQRGGWKRTSQGIPVGGSTLAPPNEPMTGHQCRKQADAAAKQTSGKTQTVPAGPQRFSICIKAKYDLRTRLLIPYSDY